MVSLKFSSTTFRTLENSRDQTTESSCFFDRNGLTVPYTLLLYLLSHQQFTGDFCSQIRAEFEKRGNLISWELEEDENPGQADFEDEQRRFEAEIEEASQLEHYEGLPIQATAEEIGNDEEEEEEEEIGNDDENDSPPKGMKKRKRGKNLAALTASTKKNKK